MSDPKPPGWFKNSPGNPLDGSHRMGNMPNMPYMVCTKCRTRIDVKNITSTNAEADRATFVCPQCKFLAAWDFVGTQVYKREQAIIRLEKQLRAAAHADNARNGKVSI